MSAKALAVPEAKNDHEPSMEEILDSIRRIIADDSLLARKDGSMVQKKLAPVLQNEKNKRNSEYGASSMPEFDADEDSDVLDLARVATASPLQRPALQRAVEAPATPEKIPSPSPSLAQRQVENVAKAVAPPPAVKQEQAVASQQIQNVKALEERILSDNTGSVVSQAFQSLSRHSIMPEAGRSVEDVVVELLRPMLRNWLDDNLPSIVERLVRAEIERVARGG